MLRDHELKNVRRHQHVRSSLGKRAGYRGRRVSHRSSRHLSGCLMGRQELRAQVCRARLGLPWHQRSLEDLLRPVPGWHDKVHRLEDARDGWVRYLPLEGPSIIAMRVQERHAHTSHAEVIGDANHRVQREAVPDEIPRRLLFVVILWDDDSTAVLVELRIGSELEETQLAIDALLKKKT